MLDTLTLSANQTLVQSVMSKSIRRTRHYGSSQEARCQILSSCFVSISAFRKQINNIYTALGEIEDERSREIARSGMRAMVEKLTSENDTTKIIEFNHRLRELKHIAPDSFRRFFTLVDAIEARGLNSGKWLDTE